MTRTRVAVVGCGYLGSIHARLWQHNERAILVGVYDVAYERAVSLAQELGVRAFSSLEETLAACDAVTVASSTTSHAEVACLALSEGKHVLLEKPVAATLSEADRIAVAAAAGTVVHVGHVERYNPAFQAVRSYVARPLFIEAHRLSPFRVRGADVSVISDLMIHDLDLILSLLHEPIVRIEAHGVCVISDSIDIANARIEFAGGCIANLTASRLTPKPLRKLRIFQPNAYLSLDFSIPDLEVYRLVTESTDHSELIASHVWQGKAIIRERPELVPTNAIADEHRAFINSILDGEPAVVSLSDGIAALQVATTIEHRIAERIATLRTS